VHAVISIQDFIQKQHFSSIRKKRNFCESIGIQYYNSDTMPIGFAAWLIKQFGTTTSSSSWSNYIATSFYGKNNSSLGLNSAVGWP
jgi:hypothetical protein